MSEESTQMQKNSYMRLDDIQGDDAEDTRLLNNMAKEAKNYLTSFYWCKNVVQGFFCFGVGGILAIFLFEIENSANVDDRWLWVIAGDLPSAYLVTDVAKDPDAALRIYIGIMQDWVDAVLAGKSTDDFYPVEAPPTKENGVELQKRINFLREEFLAGD